MTSTRKPNNLGCVFETSQTYLRWGGPKIKPLADVARTIKQTSDFVKGAAWGAGMTLYEVGNSICVSDDDARTLIQRYRKSPPPIRRQAKPKPRMRKAVPA